ncbi:MAG TPA: L,D-transpeptidase family protein [Rhizomicrobium sp.]|nr:L,D-transpeptidase family protein [Rhizomicrobium sp.]
MRTLAAITLAGLAAALLGLMPQACAGCAAAAPQTAILAPIRAPVPGPRIRYPTDSYPQLTLPGGRREVVRSILNITKPMRFGDFAWNEDGIPAGNVWVRIDLTKQLLSVFRGGHEIGSAVILYGTDGKATPVGSFTILEKNSNYYSRSYDAPMPYMLRLTKDGVAIHGSNVREGWATHGCIGVPLDFARLLFGVAKKGDPVIILSASAKKG